MGVVADTESKFESESSDKTKGGVGAVRVSKKYKFEINL